MLVTDSTNAAGEISANKCVLILNSQDFFERIINLDVNYRYDSDDKKEDYEPSGVTVKDKYNLTKKDLRDHVNFVVIENVGGAFQISYESHNAAEAKEIMTVILHRAQVVLNGAVNIQPIESVHDPIASDRQIPLKTAIGGVVGLVVAIATVFVVRAIEKNKKQKENDVAQEVEQLAE
jgi:hypothetical protein